MEKKIIVTGYPDGKYQVFLKGSFETPVPAEDEKEAGLAIRKYLEKHPDIRAEPVEFRSVYGLNQSKIKEAAGI